MHYWARSNRKYRIVAELEPVNIVLSNELDPIVLFSATRCLSYSARMAELVLIMAKVGPVLMPSTL